MGAALAEGYRRYLQSIFMMKKPAGITRVYAAYYAGWFKAWAVFHLAPVLFEFPTYEYVTTGDKIVDGAKR